MIQRFRGKHAANIYQGIIPKGFPAVVAQRARDKLVQVNAAASVQDLCAVPGNRCEPLKGDRAGQWSVRVNRKWRVCFVWTPEGPSDVELVDYH